VLQCVAVCCTMSVRLTWVKGLALQAAMRHWCCNTLQCTRGCLLCGIGACFISILSCCVPLCAAVWYSVVQCVAVCGSVWQCVVVCGSVLQCVAVHCSVLQCVAVCGSELQCAVRHDSLARHTPSSRYYGTLPLTVCPPA